MLSYVNIEKKDCILFYGSRNIYAEIILRVTKVRKNNRKENIKRSGNLHMKEAVTIDFVAVSF